MSISKTWARHSGLQELNYELGVSPMENSKYVARSRTGSPDSVTILALGF